MGEEIKDRTHEYCKCQIQTLPYSFISILFGHSLSAEGTGQKKV